MSPTMIAAGWTSDYLIGYEAIDAQHEELFNLCDEIFKSGTDEEVCERFHAFRDNMKWHFNQEDVLMTFIGYPKLVEHVAMHSDLVNRLDDLHVHSQHDLPALIDFVRVWVVGHIKAHDMEISEFRNNYIQYSMSQPAPLRRRSMDRSSVQAFASA